MLLFFTLVINGRLCAICAAISLIFFDMSVTFAVMFPRVAFAFVTTFFMAGLFENQAALDAVGKSYSGRCYQANSS
ncbi:hypothetical protein MNBD_GAMMA23-91 [hydrothermal vent metagenome]|uniref:Uncharacterized protein n=1 Tax=hydrothermal vent metagenome TaxID=652676 RepID=A0A3B0ZEW2_9ZZZZ